MKGTPKYSPPKKWMVLLHVRDIVNREITSLAGTITRTNLHKLHVKWATTLQSQNTKKALW